MVDIVVGNYGTTTYNFSNNTRRIIVRNFYDVFNQSTVKLLAKQNYPGFILGAPSAWASGVTISDASNNNTAPGALTVGAVVSGGSVNVGTHSYKVTFVNQYGGQTALGTTSSVATTTTLNKTVPLSNIPTGSTGTGTVARYIYRTISGNTSNYKLLTTLDNNTTTTFTDTIADSQLGVDGPLSNEYGIYTIDYGTNFPALLTGDVVFIYCQVPNQVEDSSLNIVKTINQTPEWSHYIDQNEPIDYTNQAAGTTRDVLYTAGFTNLFIGLVGSTGAANSVILTLQIPLKSTCVDTDDVNWKDVTKDLTGQDTLTITASTTVSYYWVWNQFPIERLMFKAIFANGGSATNTLTISTKLTN